jgi:hypothetical protein
MGKHITFTSQLLLQLTFAIHRVIDRDAEVGRNRWWWVDQSRASEGRALVEFVCVEFRDFCGEGKEKTGFFLQNETQPGLIVDPVTCHIIKILRPAILVVRFKENIEST